MIKLTKVVLINWMYFQKATLPIEGNAAIVGVNGTGKSTIIDAIQMLLLGNKASKFNANANAEKRTLESYVRGAVNTEEKEYLRNGDVVTYLALEVELNGVKNIFGININYKYERSELSDPKYFYIQDTELSEDMFISNKYPKTYDVFSKEYKPQYYATLTAYQNKVKDILGLKDAKKYFQTLSRAVGIKNITNCNDFMNEFVLDDNPIDVDAIKKNILEMEKVNTTIELEEKKLNDLNVIVEKGNEITKSIETKSFDEIKKDLANISLLKSSIKVQEELNRNLQEEVNNIEESKNGLNEHVKKLHDDERDISNSINRISPDLEAKRKELNTTRDLYNKIHLELNTFNSICENELANLSALKRYKKNSFVDLYEYLLNKDLSSSKTRLMFEAFVGDAEDVKNQNARYANKLETEIEDTRDKLIQLNDIIKKLKDNKFTYNPKLDEFKEYIKSSLEDKYHEEIEVKYLCEYLEIGEENKEWQRAIEGYLNTQRFYIVVPNKYYKDALKLYHSKKDFYLTRIINGTRLPEMDFEENTLGSFIVSSNSTALNYARFILNRVNCAKDIYDLENYDIAVTKDCMHYQNYSVGRLNVRACDEQYIGQNGIKAQLIARQKEYDELSEHGNLLKNEFLGYRQTVSAMDAEIKFARKVLESPTYIPSIDEDVRLFDLIDSIEEVIRFYESNPQYIELTSRLAEIEKEIVDCSKQINVHDKSLIDIKANIKNNNDFIEKMDNEIISLKALLESKDVSIVEMISAELEKTKISKSYVTSLESEIIQLERNITKEQLFISNLMKNARDEYNINVEPKFESLDKFKEELNKINQSVFKYQSKLVEFKKNNRKLFFSQFLSKLYNAIEKAKVEIDNLNHSLSVFDFGKDYYKIKWSITEKLDFRCIYDYAKKYNADDSDRGLFIDRDQEDRERNKIQDILNEYMFSTDTSLNNMIVDYRNYLVFDVEAHTPNGVKSLNKVMKTQSGGEVQVPFYILSGVAFQQTLDYKRNKDVLGIVLYDEAFDKMDAQRIQSMLQFYRDKLNLQLVLATPGKLDSLVDNIETILAVVRDGENAIVSDISHEI